MSIRRAKEHLVAFEAMSTQCEVRRRILHKDDAAKPFADRQSIPPNPWDGGDTFQVA